MDGWLDVMGTGGGDGGLFTIIVCFDVCGGLLALLRNPEKNARRNKQRVGGEDGKTMNKADADH